MVNSPRSAIVAVAIWVTAVAGVSATAWVAIDRAGRDITAADVSTLAPGPLTTPTRLSGPLPTAQTPGGLPTSTPARTPTPTAVEQPTTSAPSATPGRTPTARPPSPLVVKDKTIRAAGGQVSVRCSGATIKLRSAQPDNDWSVHVDTYSTRVIEVTFRYGDEEEGSQKSKVTALCLNGTPSFKVRNR